MPKQGFKNQWVAISRVGKVADNTGVERDLNEDFLKKVCANFTANNAPAVIGHPKDNNPAYGWVSDLRLNNNVLEAQFADTNDAFEEMCEQGLFRKRSASFYIGDKPSLRHVGFLGAMPPAVKGLRDIQFNDGDSVTVEISFSEEKETMKDEEVKLVADSLFDRLKGYFKPENPASVVPPPATAAAPATASFGEADVQALLDKMKTELKAEAKAEAVAEFSETIKGLQDAVNANSASGRRAEIIAFVEAIPAQKGKHFLKKTGIVEFMEACATFDAANENKESISFSEGEGDKKVEHKFTMLDYAKNLITALPPMIEFGEKFGSITATAEVQETEMKRPEKVKSLMDKVGVVDEKDGGKQ